jgi:hypothetical protein
MAYSAIAATLKYQMMVHQRINRLMEQGNYRNKAYHKRKENRL